MTDKRGWDRDTELSKQHRKGQHQKQSINQYQCAGSGFSLSKATHTHKQTMLSRRFNVKKQDQQRETAAETKMTQGNRISVKFCLLPQNFNLTQNDEHHMCTITRNHKASLHTYTGK